MPDKSTEKTVTGEKAERPGGAEDKTIFRLAAFGAVLIVVLLAGYGIGRLTNDPTTPAAAQPATVTAPATAPATNPAMPGMTMNENQPHTHNADGTVAQGGTPAMAMGAVVGGLSLSSAGLTIKPESTTFAAAKPRSLAFKITNAAGAPITTFAVVHDKPLHLVIVRRDLTGFQHLHPTMAPDGTWSIDLTLAAPGSYRAIADFTAIVGGQQLATTLGADLTVAGDYRPVDLPAPVQVATAGNFRVAYEGKPRVESTEPLLMTVTGPDGKPATLEPYLGSFGHLVVLREGDVGYLHVHPEAALVDGKIRSWLAVPGPGRYRMFFDFQVAGRVHTAAWSLTVS